MIGYGPVRPLHETLKTIGLAPKKKLNEEKADQSRSDRRRTLEEARQARVRQYGTPKPASPAGKTDNPRLKTLLEEVEALARDLRLVKKEELAPAKTMSGPEHVASICKKAIASLEESDAAYAEPALRVFQLIAKKASGMSNESLEEAEGVSEFRTLVTHLVSALGKVQEDWDRMGIKPEIYMSLSQSVRPQA